MYKRVMWCLMLCLFNMVGLGWAQIEQDDAQIKQDDAQNKSNETAKCLSSYSLSNLMNQEVEL
jgi:hypothetical protein